VTPQIAIVVFGLTAMHLVASGSRRLRFWGGVVGLCGQPFWVWTTIAHEQYLITGLCVLYAWGWIRTIRNNRLHDPLK
jgi:hypothetical protein